MGNTYSIRTAGAITAEMRVSVLLRVDACWEYLIDPHSGSNYSRDEGDCFTVGILYGIINNIGK